jgi:hypothetical protein
MSNRNFDASVITKRLGNKAIAKSIISNFNNVNSQPQTSNMNASIINEVEMGNSLFVTRGPTCTTYDLGCPCPISTSVTSVIPQTGWFTRIAGTGNSFGYGVARDSDNNIIVIGVYETADITIYNIDGSIFGTLPYSGGNRDAFLVKYNSNGTAIWATRIAGIGNDFGFSVAVDSNIPDNNIIITGYYTAATTFYNADGSGTSLTLPGSGGADVFIVKYNSNGTGIWATRIAGGGSTVSPQPGLGVSVDSFDNSIIVTGYYGTTVTIYNATPLPSGTFTTLPTLATNGSVFHTFIVKYDSDGIGQWATRIAPVVAGGGFIFGLGVKIIPNSSSAGDIIVTGAFAANATIFNAPGTVATLPTLVLVSGTSNVFIVKYNSSGVGQWSSRIAGTVNDRGYGVAVDSSNNIIVTGFYTGIATIINPGGIIFGTLPNSGGGVTNDVFIVKYNSSGFGIWATRIGGANNERGQGVTVDSLNNIIVTGYYALNTITIYNAPGGTVSTLPTLTNSGTNDVFIVKYNSSGIGQWATRIAGTADDTGNSITVDSNNNIIVTGYYSSSPVTIYNTPGTLVAGTLVNTGLYDVFLVKYMSNGFI